MTLTTAISQYYDEDFSFLEGINSINEFTIKSQQLPLAEKFKPIIKLLNFAGIEYKTSIKINNNPRIFPIYLPQYRLIFDVKESYIKGTFQEINGNLRRQTKTRIMLIAVKRKSIIKQSIHDIKCRGHKVELNKLITKEHNKKMNEFSDSVRTKPIGLGVFQKLRPDQSEITIKLANRKMIDHIYFLKQKGYSNPLLPNKIPNNITRMEAWQIIQTAEKQLLKSKKIQRNEMYVEE